MNTYRMRTAIIGLALIVISIEIIVISAHPNYERGDDPHEVRENIIDLFKSIREKKWNKTSNFRKVLHEDVVQDKQVFDTMKDVLRHAPRRHVENNENLDHITVFKRGTGGPCYFMFRVSDILKSGSPDSLPLLEDVKSMYPGGSVSQAIARFSDEVDPEYENLALIDPLIVERLETCDDEELIQYLALFKLLHRNYFKAVRIVPKLPAYKERVMTILKSGSPDSLPLLEAAKSMWPVHPVEKAIKLFATSIDVLYEEARHVVDPVIRKSLETWEEEELIRLVATKLFRSPSIASVRRPDDEKYMDAVQIIQKLLASADNQISNSREDSNLYDLRDDFRCIRMSRAINFIFNRSYFYTGYDLRDEYIKEFFYVNVPRVIHYDKDANGNIHFIKVRFEDINDALSASIEHDDDLRYGCVGKEPMQVKMIPCDGFGSDDPPIDWSFRTSDYS